jgi:hypothetical protein
LELEAHYPTHVEVGQQHWFAQVDKPSWWMLAALSSCALQVLAHCPCC